MNDSFVLLAAVFAAFAAGLAIAALAWWIHLRRAAPPTAADAAPKRTRAPLILLAASAGLLASVAVLYALSDRTPTPPPVAQNATAPTPAVDALAASLGVKPGALPAAGAPDVTAARQGGDLPVMTERLEKRLKEKTPDDRAGWALLARSYVALGRDADAIAAFEKAGGAASSDELLRSEFEATKKRVAGGGVAAPTAPSAAPAASAASPVAPADTKVLLGGKVELAKGMEAPQGKHSALFIIVRDGEQTGAPLATKRLAATAFPMNFELTDADSMLPGQKLSAAKNLTIRARLSQSGDATAQPGDIESEPQSVTVGKTALTLPLSKRRA